MNISIIIPNYNGAVLLKKNLPKILDAVKNYKDGKIEIIIADDPSTDNSKEIINKFIESIDSENIVGKTIENKDQRLAGFSKNVNRGVSISTGEILILLNTDVYPNTDFLNPLLKHFEDHVVFAVGCMDISIESGKNVIRGRGIGSWQRGFLVHSAGQVNKNSTFWVSGGSGAFRRTTWNKLNGLDQIYDPFYWEDIDLSYNAVKSGYKIVFEPKSIVTHEHEEGTVRKLFADKYIKQIAYRNQIIFVWKNISDNSLLVSHLFWIPYHIINTITKNDFAFIKGLFGALMLFPKILKKRTANNKLAKLSDKNILNSVKD